MSSCPEADDDGTLFSAAALLPAPIPVTGIPGESRGPAASDAALAGDGYGWLAALLPAPAAPACDRCGTVMRLPAAAPVIWACPSCYPQEAQ
jgi:hypothetical protein